MEIRLYPIHTNLKPASTYLQSGYLDIHVEKIMAYLIICEFVELDGDVVTGKLMKNVGGGTNKLDACITKWAPLRYIGLPAIDN